MGRSFCWVAVGLSAALFAGESWSFQTEQLSEPLARSVHLGQHGLPELAWESRATVLHLRTTARSYFKRDAYGAPIPEMRNGKQYFKMGEGVYTYERSIHTGKTALIVMDPWEDSGSPFVNHYYEPIIREKLMPLIKKAISLGLPVLVLTNPPTAQLDYGSKVYSEIEALAQEKKLHIVYHGAADSAKFAQWLRRMSIDTLIYSGFASNMCVIGRDLGMIPMQLKGFKLFFVPEASAAIEFQHSWKSGALHEATTILISQGIGELIDLHAFLAL